MEVSIIKDLKEKADQDLKDQKYNEAVETYSCALECHSIEWIIFPGLVPEILIKRAECYFKLGDLTKAIEDSREVITVEAHDPTSEALAGALYLEANAHLSQNTLLNALVPAFWLSHLKPKTKKVVKTLQRLKDGLQTLFAKDNANENKAIAVLMNYGIKVFESKLNTKLAVHIFTETIGLCEHLFVAGAHVYRGWCFLQMGQIQDAHRDCFEVLARDPHEKNARKLMAEIQECIKQTEKSQTKPREPHTCQVPKRETCSASAHVREDEILFFKKEADKRLKEKKYTEAVGMYGYILRSMAASQMNFPDLKTNVLCKKAEGHIKLGQFVDAVEDSTHAMHLDVAAGDKGHLFVSLYLHMKSLEGLGKVLDAYKEAIELGYMKPEAAKIKTATQQLRQKLRDLFDEVREREDETLSHLMTFGIKTLEMGKSELASLIFTETMNLFHTQVIPGALLYRARCFLEMGQLDDAHNDCLEVLHYQPRNTEALDLKKEIQRRKEKKPSSKTKERKHTSDGKAGNEPVTIETKKPAPKAFLPPNNRETQRAHFVDRLSDSFGIASEMSDYELEKDKTDESVAVQCTDDVTLPIERILEPEQAKEEKESEVSTLVPENQVNMDEKPAKKGKKTKKKKQKEKLNEEVEEKPESDKPEEIQNLLVLQQQEDYHKCVESLDVQEGKSKKAKKKKKKKQTIHQEVDTGGTGPSTDRPFSKTLSQGTLSAASSVSNLSVVSSVETNIASNLHRNATDSQLRVYIVCQHFFQENHTRAASLFYPRKYCTDCEKRSSLRYAFWCRRKSQWQVLRPYPQGVRGLFQQCKHYLMNRPCGRTPCTFAHGAEEIEIWTTQRKRGDTRNIPSSSNDLFVEGSMSSLRTSSSVGDLRETHDSRKAATHKSGDLTANTPPPPEGQTSASQVASQEKKSNSWTVVTSKKTKAEAKWCMDHAEQTRAPLVVPAKSISPIPPQYSQVNKCQGSSVSKTLPVVVPPLSGVPKAGNTDDCEKANIIKPVSAIRNNQATSKGHSAQGTLAVVGTHVQRTANSTSLSDFPVLSSRHPGGPTASTTGPSAWSSGAPRIQPQQPSDMRNPTNSVKALPQGIYIVCAHFLQEHMTRAASVNIRDKVYKGCENRCKLYYALWCNKKKSWRVPRDPPADVTGAFQLCKHYENGERCRKEPCTFAHGHVEVLFWTMKRAGDLQSPGKRLQAQIENTGGRLTMQHLKQYQYRPPPPGVFNGAYKMCKTISAGQVCRYGKVCLFAHGQDELNAWKKEHEKKKKMKKKIQSPEEEAVVQYVEEITRAPDSEHVDSMEGVTIQCTPPERHVTLNNDGDQHKWKFCLTYKPAEIGHLRHVLLLHRYHHCYKLTDIQIGHYEVKQNHEVYIADFTAKLEGFSYKVPPHQIKGRAQIDVTIAFSAPVFGTFAQCLLFDFGRKPHLVQRLNVDVCSKDISDKLTAFRDDVGQQHQIWDENAIEVVRLVSIATAALQSDQQRKRYSLPKGSQNIISAQLMTGEAVKGHYKENMHQLLFIEETYMRQQIGRYCLHGASLHAQRSVFDERAGMRWAADGELYGILRLDLPVTPDDTAGRLFIRNVCAVWLKPAVIEGTPSKRVYEAQVEKVENDSVVLKLSARICDDLQLYDTCDSHVEAQFQLNREPLCQMHAAIDNLWTGQLKLLFPDPAVYQVTRPEFDIRCSWLLKPCLNDQQREVIKAIVSPGRTSPPLVVFGPFGTGKTFVLSQAVRQLVQDRSNRVLLCTHSNKAADIHVELLDDYLEKENGILAARPLRVYQPMRKFEATSERARKYCLMNNFEFVLPSRQDVIKHHVVVTTLVTSRLLLKLQLHHGIFTHILVDEAAQALEPEAIIPLALAGPNTKVVLTGDHMQMTPDVYSPYAKNWGLQRSLPERLFDHYEAIQDEEFKNAHVIFLTENYRSHEDILNFPSDNFYGGKLVARGHAQQPAHPRLGPLVFYTARGIEQPDQDHSFMNLSEVSEVVKRVEELAEDWPTDQWGVKDLSQIVVLSAYKYQVQAIRSQFRKRNLKFRDVTVDTIHNVQGQEFRAVFISTVRTLNTCKKNSGSSPESAETYYLEFLSDPKLLNTAVTRAMSLVAVVGDPISLCTIGNCRGLWRDYIKRCNNGNSLHGTTIQELDEEIIESVKSIPLNPDAVSFMPISAQTQELERPTEESSAKIEEDLEQLSLELERNEESSSTIYGDDTKEVKTGAISEKGSVLSSEAGDAAEDDLDLVSYEDFQGENLEDATVFPRYMDEIIKALISKCEETLTKDSSCKSMFQESEFPSLRQANITSNVKQPQHPTFERRATGVELAERCPGDYDMVTINGRVEIRLVNLGFHQTPSVHARRLLVSTRPQECLQPEVLRRLLQENPDKYLACTLRLNPEKGRLAFGEVQDTDTPDIEITGRVRQAFDKDTVVIELIQANDSIQGKIIGTLEHIISPHERQYVCTVDYDNLSLLRPLNKSVTKMVNLSAKEVRDMPVYKMDRNTHATKIYMFERNKVLSGEYLFVTRYLQWRPDCTHPLGIVVKPLPKGNTAQHSMEIAFAEHGVQKSFRGAEKEVRKTFPPSWAVPANELFTRQKVSTAFTIDPPESLDLDDALSVESTPDNKYRVGIHIADVSYFVQPDSILDQEAGQRCTSYYPGHGQESIPMIPRGLSEAHCSLLPHQDRLAVSIFLCLNNEGEVIGQPDICRTVVKSCCRLTYSQAQKIIDQPKLKTGFPQSVLTGVRTLNTIAQNKRRTRLGDGADVGHDDVKEDFEAHELVQEMMILANKTVAEYLVCTVPHLAPLRTQLPPKKHRLTEWLQENGKYLEYLHINQCCMNVVVPDPEPAAKTLKIHQSAWADICKAAEEPDMAKLTRLIYDKKSKPQLSVAHAQFRRIQARGRYLCAGDQSEESNIHYSMGVPNYTHFTSPIRRYIDILVHRLVLNCLGKDVSISKDEITKICRRCTFYQANASKFGKTCRKIHLAKQLKDVNQEIYTIVESVKEGRINLHIPATDYDLLGGREKQLKVSLLNPIGQSQPEGEGEQCIELKLRFRMYYAPRETATSLKQPAESKEGQHAEEIPSSEIKAMLSDDLTEAYNLVDIPGEKWLEMLEAVKSGDAAHLDTLIKTMVKYPRTEPNARNDPQVAPQFAQTNRGGRIYQHPHYGEKATGTENEGHFYDMSLLVRQYDSLPVQLTCHTIKGVSSPDIQLLKLTSQVNVCLEHQKYPCDSFATTAHHNASRQRYHSTEEYTQAWTPVLAMEAATEAVSENDSFSIAKLGVRWEIKEVQRVGHATLPVSYCTSRQLELYAGDLICIRVRYEDCEGRCPADLETGGNVCVADVPEKHPQNRETRCGDAKDVHCTNNPKDYWVGHCILEDCRVVENKEQVQLLKFRLHQTSSDVPQGLFDGKIHASTFEMIHRTLPQRRMYAALNLIPDASNLVCAICQGQEPVKEEDFGKPPLQLSLSRHYPKSKLKELNFYQEKAVKEALANPLTLIQGPPGTGKTVTGVHIAHWFAQRNKTLRTKQPLDQKTSGEDDTKVEEGPKAPPQVLYCGPSNKSVDVVTEYLLRETELKVLRVCSGQLEQHEFPIPNKLKPIRATRSADEMLILSPAVQNVCLHHVIRAPGSPFAEDLKKMEDKFKEDKLRNERTSDECVQEYRRLIFDAEVWAIRKTDVQIILCTCTVAGSPRIEFACDNILQCIVDECGMCLEPETLIPITRQNIKQIILIGDHKQLQPVIKDNVAKTLGLQISMFERLSKWANMLQRQYRMHEAICEFPSRQFYDGKLETDRSVKSRAKDGIDWWPAYQLRRADWPVVFCHVEGKEETTFFRTAESNEQSKSNMKEVNKAVYLANLLVNRYSIDKRRIVIMSPYRDQRSKITEKLKGRLEEIEVTTFTKSQGSEWDYVIMSLVRSLPEHEIDPDPSTHWLRENMGFITDHHQINVALTRARRGMCIIGNKNLLRVESMWGSLLEHYEQHECVVDESWPWT